jgi:hypothetical protein
VRVPAAITGSAVPAALPSAARRAARRPAVAAAGFWLAIGQPCLAQEAADRQIVLEVLTSACLDHPPDFAGAAAALLATGDYYETGTGRALQHAASGLTVEVVAGFGEPACLVGTFSTEDARSLAAELQDLPPAGKLQHWVLFIVDHESLQGAGVLVRFLPEGATLE